MGSSKRPANETEEERKARKRAKKESKKAKRRESSTSGEDFASQQTDVESLTQDEQERTDDATPDKQPVTGPDEAAGLAIKQEVCEKPVSHPTKRMNPFSKCDIRLSLGIYPSALADVDTHLRTQVQKCMLLKFFDSLQGVLLGYETMDVNKDKKLRGAEPHVHFVVTLRNALLFGPIKEGTDLIGVVTEACYASHVGVLIQDWFHASIASSELEAAGYEYDVNLQRWASNDATIVSEHDKITFSVLKIHAVEGVISMEGTKPKIAATAESTG